MPIDCRPALGADERATRLELTTSSLAIADREDDIVTSDDIHRPVAKTKPQSVRMSDGLGWVTQELMDAVFAAVKLP
ncbi:MAG TPA: hypothetical protein VGY91_15610 [Chthoniobacterales bacterium]|nr:hypothetical protein [Chthoniobacterales bacterium]